MGEEIDQEILNEFITETLEELEALDAKFIALEKSPEDSDVINAIFRTVHSIKGSSSFFSLDHIRSFAHKFENLLDELRKGKKQINKEAVDILLRGKDCLREMFDRLTAGDMGQVMTDDEAAVLQVIEDKLEQEEEEKESPEKLFVKINGLTAAISAKKIGENNDVAQLFELIHELQETILGPDKKQETGSPKVGEILVKDGVVTKEDLMGALTEQKKVGDILVGQGKASPADVEQALKKQTDKQNDIAKAKAPPGGASAKAGLAKTMRIEEDKIDEFMNLVGELIINSEVFNYIQKKLESPHDVDKIIMEFKNANVIFNELTLNLQRGLAEVRKVPLKGIFQKLPRLVRDLGAQISKEIDFTMSGEDLLIDKSLLEELENPLIHMLRNSIDHGIESAEERIKAGKNKQGKVEVTAEEVAGDLVIRISDDGAGMDAEALKAKAIEKNLITPEDAAQMSDREANKLIFAPGFSTAAKITDVSGRGVGMDVVMTMITSVKGKLDIDTTLGQGSTFVIMVPLSTTLITISGFLVAVGEEHYIIPIEWVRESFCPKRDQVTSIAKKGEVVQIREQLYPLVRLHNLFDVDPLYKDPSSAVVMMLEKDDQTCCLLVDSILDETQAVLKDLGGPFRGIKGVMGGAILGDGKIGLVLDVEGLMSAHAGGV